VFLEKNAGTAWRFSVCRQAPYQDVDFGVLGAFWVGGYNFGSYGA